MKLTKDILDKKVKEFEENIEHDMTFREWIRAWEEYLEIEHENLDDMDAGELAGYDDWLLELLDK